MELKPNYNGKKILNYLNRVNYKIKFHKIIKLPIFVIRIISHSKWKALSRFLKVKIWNSFILMKMLAQSLRNKNFKLQLKMSDRYLYEIFCKKSSLSAYKNQKIFKNLFSIKYNKDLLIR